MAHADCDRSLTAGEVKLARAVFGDAINYADVRICHRKWAFFQPSNRVMAPMGNIHFHPASKSYVDDFATAKPHQRALFIHEMVHVWQAQTRGRWFLVLMRWPLDKYAYNLDPNRPFKAYGLEQQAKMVEDYYLLSVGEKVAGAASIDAYRAILPREWPAHQAQHA